MLVPGPRIFIIGVKRHALGSQGRDCHILCVVFCFLKYKYRIKIIFHILKPLPLSSMGINIRDIMYFREAICFIGVVICHTEITANAIHKEKKNIRVCAVPIKDTLSFIYPDKLAATVIIIISWL